MCERHRHSGADWAFRLTMRPWAAGRGREDDASHLGMRFLHATVRALFVVGSVGVCEELHVDM